MREERTLSAESERAEAKTAAYIAAATWATFVIAWYVVQGSGGKIVGAIALLFAVFWTARWFFHASTVGIVMLAPSCRSLAQVAVVSIAATIPLFYLVPGSDIRQELVVHVLTSPAYLLAAALFGWCSYIFGKAVAMPIAARRYLLAAGAVFVVAYITKHGIQLGDDDFSATGEGPIPDAERAVLNYALYLTASFVGISVGRLRSKPSISHSA